MVIFKEAEALHDYISRQRLEKNRIGFVPTMGALHEGHLALIEASKKENSITICSIFINPTQFNNQEDFNHYPVRIENDVEMLTRAKCDILFLPAVEEIYPQNWTKKRYAIGEIEHVLEGKYRPGHFQGVCQVVDRLLDIVTPDSLYLGQKDLQQCIVIAKLLQITNRPHIQLHIVPTVREQDGLAKSSRNLRLTNAQRKKAVSIYKQLQFMKENLALYTIGQLKKYATEQLEKDGFQVDYVEIAENENLVPASSDTREPVGLIAASIGNVRLIDNMPLY